MQKICSKHKIFKNMQCPRSMSPLHLCAKICEKKYARYVSMKLICKICSTHIAELACLWHHEQFFTQPPLGDGGRGPSTFCQHSKGRLQHDVTNQLGLYCSSVQECLGIVKIIQCPSHFSFLLQVYWFLFLWVQVTATKGHSQCSDKKSLLVACIEIFKRIIRPENSLKLILFVIIFWYKWAPGEFGRKFGQVW